MQPLINLAVLGLGVAGIYVLYRYVLSKIGPHQMDMLLAFLAILFVLAGFALFW